MMRRASCPLRIAVAPAPPVHAKRAAGRQGTLLRACERHRSTPPAPAAGALPDVAAPDGVPLPRCDAVPADATRVVLPPAARWAAPRAAGAAQSPATLP